MYKKTLIIAEAGVNHNGDIELAKKLIDIAAEAGADVVKFQTFIAENVISKNAVKAEYQTNNTGTSESQLDMVKKLELSFDDFVLLKSYAEEKGIEFLSTPFDLESISFLDNLGVRLFKIPSGEITNLPYLEQIAARNKEIILSTGMASMAEIDAAVKVLVNSGTARDKISILHCTTEYPAPFSDVNLRAMQSIRDAFNLSVGYSDHTSGIEVAIAAVSLGAEIIEKHFTLDKTMEGPDHKASLDPLELKAMVHGIRNVEAALGTGVKAPAESEKKNIPIARKSIHLKQQLDKGHVLTENDLIMKRPGDGISPMEYKRLIGCILRRDCIADHQLEYEDIENESRYSNELEG
ncbi:N-acetylneuraminate synthase [Oleiphilus messinensis]|uniref:N-acetylneuraminate synthase n=1 Tax=Oleiphilus messinensis TaxID=141451 RepID=A0A1Y0IGX9_9GAMM|nr:N-acetylneuraminate synthase [Oleiphilus messinensis]ARU59560.1 N-acetylneuraminate synthase [Oleiphilus messinensis]